MAHMGPGQPDFSKFLGILVITMSARTADSALRARRPRAVRHCHFTIENLKSVDTFHTSNKKDTALVGVARGYTSAGEASNLILI